MTMILLLLVGLAAAEIPDPPQSDDPASGECEHSIPLRAGLALPASLLDGTGLARCSAVAEPLSSYAHLLKMEVYARQIHDLYGVDIASLQAENERLRAWHRQPWFVAVTTTALVTGALVTYDLTTRSTR